MNLHFFTASFPFKTAETFIENEIPVLAGRFEKVFIFVHHKPSNDEHRNIPENCYPILKPASGKSRLSLSDFFLLLKMILIEFKYANNKIFYLKNLRKWLSLGKKAILDAQYISDTNFEGETLFYSFWMNDWALALTVLKMQKKIPGFVFRCAGFDIWDERHPGNYLPFRGLIYKYADGIFPNSKIAESYLKKKNIFPDKIKCFYLGTTDYGIAPFNRGETFTLVSCSHITPLKRVHLIVEIIRQLDFPIRWIHFGVGSEYESVKENAENLDAKHRIEFRGFVTNDDFYSFFKHNSVNLFITTSSSEGLPVTLQEAASFGIPALATNVGGVSEVVNNETGILLPSDFNPADAAEEIRLFKSSSKNTIENRLRIREFWQQKYKAEETYNKFVDELLLIKKQKKKLD